MDSLNIFSAIITLSQVTSTVIQMIGDIKELSKCRKKILDEVSSAAGFLFALQDLAKTSEKTESWHNTLGHLNTPGGPLERFKLSMESLISILDDNKSSDLGRAQRALASPFRGKQMDKINKILQAIERQKLTFALALQNYHLCHSLDMRRDVERVRDELQALSSEVSQVRANQDTSLQERERDDLLAWVSPLNFWTKQNDVFSRRQEGTGEWLLEHELFKQWLSGIEKTLWCPGIPGAGKTTLASVVINYLDRKFEGENVGIAYIYCAYREQTHTAANLIASLLKQLLQQVQHVSGNILDVYKHHRDKKTRPPLHEYSRLLASQVRHFSKIFIVIDALDECSEEEKIREQFMTEVRKLLPSVSLLVTSRDIPDMKPKFTGTARLEIRASDGDIRQYLESRITTELAEFLERDKTLQSNILTTIVEKAQGMFLLAQLHMDSLGRELNLRGLKEALRSLPKSLDETHEEAMKRIQSQDSKKVALAEQVLSWICYALRPMTVDEIRFALAVAPGDTDLNEESLIDGNLLVSVCAGLVTIDRDSNVIRFVHPTTQRYFQGSRISRFPNSLKEIVSTCLTYLSFNRFAKGRCSTDQEMEARLCKNPFLQYAAQYWGDHAREMSELDETVQDLVMDFLAQDQNVSCCIQVIHLPKYRYEGYSKQPPKDVSGLELAATLGLLEIVRKLLENGARVNERDSDGGTAMHWAAWGGYETVVGLLLEYDADIQAVNKNNGTPLHWAAEGGHPSIVRLLLEHEADIAAKDVRQRTAMDRAAWNGHDTVVRLFLAKNVDVNASDSDGVTILHGAAENGHEAVVRLLLKNGASVNSKDPDGGTPLHRAAWNGHTSIVQLLLEKEADVSARYSYDASAQGNMACGQEMVVRLLLEKGSDAAERYFRGGTALHWAAWSGHESVVKLLLDYGADFTAEDSDGGTALYGAAQSGYQSVVQLFLDRGMKLPAGYAMEEVATLQERDEKSPANGVSTALHWAAWNGREGMVGPLLDKGMNVNATNLNGRTALHWAAWSGHEGIVRILLAKGANITIKDNKMWTALHWAAWKGHLGVVRLLLDTGADVTAKDLDGKTAMDWAAASKHEVVVALLLESGASAVSVDSSSLEVSHPVFSSLLYNNSLPNTGISVSF